MTRNGEGEATWDDAGGAARDDAGGAARDDAGGAAQDDSRGAAGDGKPAIELLSLTVKACRVVARLRIGQERFRYMTPSRAEHLAETFPTLASHACVNGKGDTFGVVMDSTSVPHMLEHMVIELQTRSSEDPDAVFVGTSEWEDEAAGSARVQVSFTDDLQALRAFNNATQILNRAVLL